MRAVVQRTLSSRVTVDGRVISSIGLGLTVLLGIGKGDTAADADYLMDKIANLRIFPDQEGKMNLSVQDVAGEILLISQFTLYGDARKGRRPSFTEAALPDQARPMFDYCVENLRRKGLKIQTGEFGAEMQVDICNNGPCTILLDSFRAF
ncbi:MAG: D-tyrosyl-tRNA(Tyr) deacylase [Syntrophomonadaceae bacterium]|jgi:D-tyrosyl-tRNA(Tyr) deacylase|nr:D-tyrosyl-tRNA(Tyr) deacylase [Syntrophomonadaceae bacterium]